MLSVAPRAWIAWSLLGALALSAGACTGDVGETQEDVEGADSDRATKRDASTRDAGPRDASARDARARDATTRDATGPQTTQMNTTRDADAEEEEEDASPTDASTDHETGDCVEGKFHALAAGLTIREIALYQTVKLSLYKGGAWQTQRPAPVVQGKKSLLRVFVDTAAGYSPHPLRAALTLKNGDQSEVLLDQRTISAASSDADAASTFSFALEGTKLGASTELAFAIEEPTCSDKESTANGARFPATGTQALNATAIGTMRVVVVPINVGGRVPVTTDAELAAMRAALLAYYPVPDVELTLRNKVLTWSSSLAGTDSNGWTNLLNQVQRERANDQPASDVYYFGLVQPAATMQAYCGRGCIMGIAPQTVRVQTSAQVGLGASFANAQTYETMVHEIGHAHGRGHAPCVEGGQIQGVDSQFPDKTGATGVWGWDNRSNKLLPPTNKDIMGYCRPNWISAYNYGAIATRAQQVNRRALLFRGANAVRWQQVIVYSDGSARFGGALDSEEPGGELEPATVLDSAGATVAEIEVARVPLSHSEDQFLYLPEPGPAWSSIVLRDRMLALSAVLPPL